MVGNAPRWELGKGGVSSTFPRNSWQRATKILKYQTFSFSTDGLSRSGSQTRSLSHEARDPGSRGDELVITQPNGGSWNYISMRQSRGVYITTLGVKTARK